MSEPTSPSVPSASDSGQTAVPPTPVEGVPAPRYGEFAPVESAQAPAPAPTASVPPLPDADSAAPGVPAAPGQPATYAEATPGAPGYPAAPAAPGYPGATAQPGYPQQGYPQQGYPAAYPQGDYPQTGYPQQATYPQAAYPGYTQPVYGQPGFGSAPAPRRRTWDIVLTIVLLVLGLGGMAIGVFYGAFLSLVFEQMYMQYGLGSYVDDGSLAVPSAVIVISHIALYLIAAGLSVLLLVKRKVAFWLPLTAGVIAAVIFWAALLTAMTADPTIARYLGI
jgi:hypothetical protein